MECERCGTPEGVERESSRTAYSPQRLDLWQRLLLDGEGLGEPPDPNADVWLCRECAKDHHEYWNEAWNSYYGSLL